MKLPSLLIASSVIFATADARVPMGYGPHDDSPYPQYLPRQRRAEPSGVAAHTTSSTMTAPTTTTTQPSVSRPTSSSTPPLQTGGVPSGLPREQVKALIPGPGRLNGTNPTTTTAAPSQSSNDDWFGDLFGNKNSGSSTTSTTTSSAAASSSSSSGGGFFASLFGAHSAGISLSSGMSMTMTVLGATAVGMFVML